MRNVERIIQLGLDGFKKETKAQLEKKQQSKEGEKRLRIIPKGLVIYKANQPDFSYTVLEPFYVLKSKKPKRVKGMEIVRVESDLAKVYRDGQRVEWPKGTVIEVNYRKMIKKK